MSAADVAYESIKLKILSQDFRPGMQLKEVQISKELGLTRTPIREALIRLERDGLVKIVYNRGAFVAMLSENEIDDLFEVREALEVKAAYLATRRASRNDIDNVKKVLNEREMLVREGITIIDFRSHELDFHHGIIKLSKNERLISIWQTLETQLSLVRITSAMFKERYLQALKEHKEILDSLFNADFGQVEKILISHITNAKENLLSYIANEALRTASHKK